MPKNTFEVLDAANPKDAERWATLVAGSPAADAYYLPAYALASSQIEDSDPIAIVAGPEHCRFLAPLLLRRLSAVVDGTRVDWTDLCSPYGYGGLLPLTADRPAVHDLHCFLEELQDWARLRNAACCVLRLHPLMRQDEWFAEKPEGLFQLRLRGLTTAIGLDNWDGLSNRPHGLRRDRRLDLNRASRTFRVTWVAGSDLDALSGMERFFALYKKAMEDRRADSFYRFPPGYFSRLTLLGSRLGIALAWLDDQLAAASIFFAGRRYTHYHLAAANETGMKYGAATLLIAEGARWARAQHCELLHLGGGLSAGDSLEGFKRSFGSQLYRYAYVIGAGNPELFTEICRIPDAPWPYIAERGFDLRATANPSLDESN